MPTLSQTMYKISVEPTTSVFPNRSRRFWLPLRPTFHNLIEYRRTPILTQTLSLIPLHLWKLHPNCSVKPHQTFARCAITASRHHTNQNRPYRSFHIAELIMSRIDMNPSILQMFISAIASIRRYTTWCIPSEIDFDKAPADLNDKKEKMMKEKDLRKTNRTYR